MKYIFIHHSFIDDLHQKEEDIMMLTEEVKRKNARVETVTQQLYTVQKHSELLQNQLRGHQQNSDALQTQLNEMQQRSTDSPRSNTSSADGTVTTAPHRRVQPQGQGKVNQFTGHNSTTEVASEPGMSRFGNVSGVSSVRSPERLRHYTGGSAADPQFHHTLDDLEIQEEAADSSQASTGYHSSRLSGDDIPLPSNTTHYNDESADKTNLSMLSYGLNTDDRMGNFRLADRNMYDDSLTTPAGMFDKELRHDRMGRRVNFDKSAAEHSSLYHDSFRQMTNDQFDLTDSVYLPPMGQGGDNVGVLKAKLNAAENLNQTLKDEISIYENLCQSIGVQNSPMTTPSKSSPNRSSEPRSPIKPEDSDLLKRELAQLRKLRMNLEKSMKDSHQLQNRLEENMHTQDIHKGND